MSYPSDLAIVPALRSERLRAVGAAAHEDVLHGLKARRLPARLLYDAPGFELLERAWHDPSFYPARRERDLLATQLPELARAIGPDTRVIEPWHGDLARTIEILGALRPAIYIPIDGNASRLAAHAAALRAALPALDVQPAVTLDEVLPRTRPFTRTLALLPGTALSSLEPSAAVRLLTLFAALVGEDGVLLVGADATSDPAALAAAYETPAHDRWARHALATLPTDADAFAFGTRWHPAATRLDLVLAARRTLTVTLAGEPFDFAVGDTLAIDHRYQHGTEAMHAMLGIAGWRPHIVLTASPEPMRIWLCDRWRRDRHR
ncbi:MAG TPA: L-histidine N(alpha)-methyltransferase [Kofleriaceae bacterium]|nr:L-histidine N(alpha)-methyltransferase [Kofleriaceae bacterium]